MLDIQQKLMDANLWDDPSMQRKFRLGMIGSDKTRRRIRTELLELIERHKELSMVLDDPCTPLLTASQISNGGKGVHILDQYGIPMYAPFKSFPLCWLLLGDRGGGKSSAAFNILQQLPGPKLILDPKGTWRFRSSQLRARYIEVDHVSLDLEGPDNIQQPLWLYAYMEGAAYVTGLQFGLTYLCSACDIATEQQKQYSERRGGYTPLCLKDIQLALELCTTRNAKQAQYLESAKTALQLLVGKGSIFANRGGLSLDELLEGNYILSCRYLTTTQSRMLAWHILAYEYFRCFKLSETTQLLGTICFDDSSKFVSRPDSVFGAGARTSPYLHLLSNLRSTGRSCIFLSQLVQPICDDIRNLCTNWLVTGGLRGSHNQREAAAAMSLTNEQADMLGKLQTREAVCYCPGLYPRAVHGFIPVVGEPEQGSTEVTPDDIVSRIGNWHPLTEIPTRDRESPAPNKPAADVGDTAHTPDKQLTVHPYLEGVSGVLMEILWDVRVYKFSSASARVKRLQISCRAFEQGKREGYEKGLLLETRNGQTTYLLLTEKSSEALNAPYPKRNVSRLHSFRVELLQFLLRHDPSYKKVFVEYPLGQKGCTADVCALRHDSGKEGWEVTISTTNVISNLQKYSTTNFIKVVFVAPDYRLKEAVKSTISGAGLSSDLTARAEFKHFSQLLRRKRNLYRY
ncbi:hypothetical protein ACFL5Z_12890 [Planctomycetota bacterium]